MFSDISRHWAKDCILALAQRNLVNGYLDGTFRPQWVLTRAEFAALMTRIFPQLPAQQSSVSFRDVSEQFWASDAIAWVSQHGLFSGFEDGTFRPQIAISRLQAVIVLEAGLGASQPIEVAAPSALLKPQFSDAADIPAWAERAIAAALARQLLEQLPEPRPLRANQIITRGEVAALLCRALKIPADELRSSLSLTTPNRQALFQRFLDQEAGFDSEKLAFLDRGVERSPYQREVAEYASRLKAFAEPAAVPVPLTNTATYPARGLVPAVDAKGLDFLSPDVVSGCLCLATIRQGILHTRWLGRAAIENREMWSATKFVPLLNVVDRANAVAPDIPIDRCHVRTEGRPSGYPFYNFAEGIVSYSNRIATSNALAVTVKNFETPTGLESWTRQLTGNPRLTFRGRYGEVPFISRPELWDTQTRKVLLRPSGALHQGDNSVSTYDLTRLLTMAAWHYPISSQANFASAKGHSLKPVIRAMGMDTARYMDVALDALGLSETITAPVIISKSGFGRSSLRDRTELSYCALVQFSLPRQGAADFTATHQHYAFGFTLIVAKDMGNFSEEARYVDALMAAEVTEILRRVVVNRF
ncbi:MAG: S-layer homology domain-containing protein [Elainellaceae cyanobacterium]